MQKYALSFGAPGAPTDLLPSVAAAVAAFATTFAFIPWLIRNLKGTSAMGKDLNKLARPLIPEMGGMGVILGFYVGVTVLTIWGVDSAVLPYYFAALTACLGAGIVGLLDDVLSLRKRTKAVLPFILALPLGAVVAGAGNTALLGFDIGALMILAVAFGITSAANAANMLEGFNGLGAGMMLIMSTTLVVISLLKQATVGLFLLLPLVGSLGAFLFYNRYPAKVFPGDSMTLFGGAVIAAAAIVSSPALKAYGALLFVPMILEFALKARSRFAAENYGVIGDDGRLSWDGPIHSLSHWVMKGRSLRESEVVLRLWAIEALVCGFVVLLVAFGA